MAFKAVSVIIDELIITVLCHGLLLRHLMEGEKLELDCMLKLFQNRLGEELLIQLLGLLECFNPVPLLI